MKREAGTEDTADAPQLDAASASQMLESVFAECEVEPNTVPMEALASYAPYRTGPRIVQRAVLAACFALLAALALLAVPPRFTVACDGMGEDGLPIYAIEVAGIIPVSSVTASVGRYALPVRAQGGRSYAVEPARNGELVVTVTLANRQHATVAVEVVDVDSEAPEYLGSEIEGDLVRLYFSDAGVGVDLEAAYALDGAHEVVRPVRIDEAAGMVAFAYPETDMDVYVPDRLGNTLHLSMALGEG